MHLDTSEQPDAVDGRDRPELSFKSCPPLIWSVMQTTKSQPQSKKTVRTKLVLHVGPGKCGSSSIQSFFSTQNSSCIENIRYRLLNPAVISKLNSHDASKELLDEVMQQLSVDLRGCDCLILSHEFLFQNPYAVYNYCLMAKSLTEKVAIIGYCRRQSSFLASAYSQWLFRSPERIREVNAIINRLGLDPSVFTGLERQFIASIENDFYSARQLSGCNILDWHSAYNNIAQLTNTLSVTISCGALPKKESGPSLIQDFCGRANLTLHPDTKEAHREKANLSFDHSVIEAINIAIGLGIDMMGPHEGNEMISLLSSLMKTTDDSNGFVSELASYTDWHYWPSNLMFCKQYGLDREYFKPGPEISKQEILDFIAHENHKRSMNRSAVIERHQLLSARIIELCISLAKRGQD